MILFCKVEDLAKPLRQIDSLNKKAVNLHLSLTAIRMLRL